MNYTFNIHSYLNFDLNYEDVNIFFVLSGSIHLHMNDDIFYYKKNDFFVIDPYSIPMVIKTSGKFINLSINKYYFNKFSLLQFEKTKLESIYLEKKIKQAFFTAILAQQDQDSFNSDINIIKLINYIRIGDYYNSKNNHFSNPLIVEVLDYVNQNCKEDLTVSKIASEFFVNSSYLSRVFSESLNISLSQYIKKVKIYHLSKELLFSNSDQNIWKKYGYSSYFTFSKHFKSFFFITPEEFIIENQDIIRVNSKKSDKVYSYLFEVNN